MKGIAMTLTLLMAFIGCDLFSQTSFFTDIRDGQVYKTVVIGNKTWMAENLRFQSSDGSWNYLDNESNNSIYGRLYQWETSKTVCPAGWHLPGKAEFESLLNSQGGDGKKAYTSLFKDGSSGFNAVLAGWRTENGGYYFIDVWGGYWSQTPNDSEWPFLLSFYSKSAKAFISSDYIRWCGLSVRCVKD